MPPRVRAWLALTGLILPLAGALACGPFRVGVKAYPMVYERVPGRAGEYRGLDKDFFALLAARSGCRFELVLESQPRIWARLRTGSLDLTNWALPTPERQARADFVPLLRTHPVALTWRAQAVAGEADFLARRELQAVAVREASYGAGYDALLRRLRAERRVSEVADVDAAIRVFFAGRVDLLVTYPWVVAAALRERGDAVQLANWHAQAPGPLSSLALSRRTVPPADQQHLLATLRRLRADGSLQALLAAYLPRVGVELLADIAPLPAAPAAASLSAAGR